MKQTIAGPPTFSMTSWIASRHSCLSLWSFAPSCVIYNPGTACGGGAHLKATSSPQRRIYNRRGTKHRTSPAVQPPSATICLETQGRTDPFLPLPRPSLTPMLIPPPTRRHFFSTIYVRAAVRAACAVGTAVGTSVGIIRTASDALCASCSPGI